MPRLHPLAFAAGLLFVASSPGQDDAAASTPVSSVPISPVPVTWKGEDLDAATLAERVPLAAPVAARWAPFAAAHDYRLVLGDDAQVLLVLRPEHARQSARSERPKVKKLLATLHATVDEVASLLGEPTTPEPPVVLVAAAEPDYPALLDHVATIDPRLQAWAQGPARRVTGFVLSEPLAASWLDDAKGQEEWNAENELAHRAAQLLLRRLAPQQPPWFALGFGWHVEEAVKESIYCYPYRAGFVWAAEHTGWDKRLRSDFGASHRRKEKLPTELTMEEFADWDPSRTPATDDPAGQGFDHHRAGVSFGLVRHLATTRPGSLVEVARGFDAAIQEGWKVVISETEWTTDPNYRLPPAKQLEVLQRVEQDILPEVTEAFAKGKLKRHPPRH